MKKKHRQLIYVMLVFAALLQIFPLAATLLNSFRTSGAIKKSPVGFPDYFHFINYVKAWEIGNYAQAFLNSLTVSLPVCLLVLSFSVLSGFFLARSGIKIRKYLLIYYGAALSISVFSYMVPLYFVFARLNLVNTHLGLILIYTAINLPFNILLARTFIMGIPPSLDEAATIDGCSTSQLICRIIIPLSKPVITTILLIIFVSVWNEFTLANTFLQKPELKTASTRFVAFVGRRTSDMSMIYTAGMITMLPIIAVFITLQNYFIDGMTSGSIKE